VTIGVACRLAPGKGIDVLLNACALISSDHRWRVRIAGDGPEEAKLRTLVDRERMLRDRVSFVGSIADMPGFWHECDIAVVPSSRLMESFSMAAVEAMACGLPVVASAAGALPEICGDSCGIMVRPNDIQALTAALDCYLADPVRRRTDGAAGRQRVEQRFGMERMVDQYLDALQGTTHTGLNHREPSPVR
jgi:glycosyltransferase involved in cell wall biosynthesis